MAIETISLFVLGLVAVGVVSYLAGRWKGIDDLHMINADLQGQKLARKEQQRKYDELYDTLLRVNKMNTELNKRLQTLPPTYEDCADDMVTMLSMGFSRHGIADKYNVPYPTACFWIRKKQKEMENAKIDFHQSPLI